MNNEIKELWVKALRSGKYKQGSSILHSTKTEIHEYCCLGVLCELASAEIKIQKYNNGFKTFYDGQHCYLPDSVLQWIGWSLKDPSIIISNPTEEEQKIFGYKAEKYITHLSTLNDYYKLNFEQIADLIEKYL